MSYFSSNPSHCRVDFFKPSGKWYTTEVLDLEEYYDASIPVDAVKEALQNHLGGRMRGMWAVVLDPYLRMSFPIMIKIPE